MPIALLLVCLFSVLVCYLVARKRSADTKFWLLMGLLLGPLAIPFVFFSRSKVDTRGRETSGPPQALPLSESCAGVAHTCTGPGHVSIATALSRTAPSTVPGLPVYDPFPPEAFSRRRIG